MTDLVVGSILPVPFSREALWITSVDLHKEEGTFRLFETLEEAESAHHDSSLAQLPKWHAEHCAICKTGSGE